MDSMKKGMVPEEVPVPSKDQIATAAGKTEKTVQIPYNVFDEHERTGQVVTPEEMKPAAAHPDVAHKIDPARGHEQEPRKEVPKSTAPTPTTPAPAPATAPVPTPAPTAPALKAPESPIKPAPDTEVGTPKEPTITPPPTHL